jgi:hypothetical protein
MPLDPQTLKALAARGAALRYAELTAERDALVATFPDLNVRIDDGQILGKRALYAQLRRDPQVNAHALVSAYTDAIGPLPKRRAMSPAQRKAVSLRMSKYWAAKRVEKVKQDVSVELRRKRAKNGK